MNDSELVQGLGRRDAAAMQWFCDCHVPSLWRFVYTRVHGDSHLAEDITHETVLAMLTHLQANDRPELEIQNPAGWLRTVAARRIADHFRAAARVQHLLERAPGTATAAADADPAQHNDRQETRLEVRQVMDGLSDQYRLALEWKYVDKLSVREIASRWQTTEKAVESILFRARREFRERMTKTPPTDPGSHGQPSLRADSTPSDSASEGCSPENAAHK